MGDYRGGGTTEIERERIFDRSEIVKFKYKILREEFIGTPDDPTYANLATTKFICNEELSIRLI